MRYHSDRSATLPTPRSSSATWRGFRLPSRRRAPADDRSCGFAGTSRPRSPGARGGAPRRRRARAGVLLRRPTAPRPPRLGPAHAVPARVPGRPRRTRSASAGAGWSSAAGHPRRSCRRSWVRPARRRSTSAPTSAHSRAPATRGSTRALAVPAHEHPGTFVADDLGDIRTTAGKPYTVFTPFYRTVGRGAATREARRSAEAPAAPRRPRPRIAPVPRRSRTDPGDRRSAVPGRRDRRAQDDPRRLGAVLALPPLRVHIAARDRGSCQRPGQAAALLARLLRTRAAPPPPERALGVPGPVPRARSAGAERTSGSRRGARDAPAIRWSTPVCASSDARATWTTGPASSSARS